MSYLDGELDEASRAAFEAELAVDETLRAEHARLARLRDLSAAVPAAFAVPDPGELAFERLRRNILAAAASEAPAPRAAPVPAASNVTPIAPRRRGFVYAALAVAAAAAIAVFVAKPWSQGSTVAHRTDPRPSPTAVASHDPVGRALNGTEIVRVEFGKMSGTYWEQAEGDDRVAVVWIDDTVLEEVGRP